MHKNIEINSYYLKARLFPTILTVVPTLILYNKYIAPVYHDGLNDIFTVLPTITDVILSFAIVFLLVLVNRFLSKEIFQRIYFTDELNMPTTNILLKSNTEFETTIKQKIESKIKAMFDIDLLPVDEELQNEERARRLIVTTVSQIRNSLRGDAMLLRHNIEYGFFRNLIGGSLLAVIVSMVLLIYSYLLCDCFTEILSLALIIIYLIPIILSNWIINKHGKYYAKILYEQFLSLEYK
ncbi:hypothetical protein FACS1894103_2150 [Campylobacterota bacterium]|nr:hypothetical protein FACS1894103_2150 [Campylobacterota bacterium]